VINTVKAFANICIQNPFRSLWVNQFSPQCKDSVLRTSKFSKPETILAGITFYQWVNSFKVNSLNRSIQAD